MKIVRSVLSRKVNQSLKQNPEQNDPENKVTFEDTIFLTSVREPLSHYKSVFDFFYGTFNKEEKIINHFCNLACSGAPFLEMLKGAGFPFEHFMTCIPDCYDSSLPWSFRAKNFQVFEMGLDNDHDDLDRLEAHLEQMNKVWVYNQTSIL